MLRKIIALVLVRCIAQAQMPSPLPDNAVRPAQSAEQKLVGVNLRPVTTARYGKLRRGRTEEIAIHLEHSQSICLSCSSGQNSRAYVNMLSLEIEPAQGFSVQFSYDGRHFRSQDKGKIVQTRGGGAIVAKLKAGKNVPLGEYALKGKLSFEVVERDKHSAPQQVEISIPVTVVDHDAPIVKSNWNYAPFPSHKLRTTMAIILLGPLLLPALLVIVLYLTATGEEVH